MKLRLPFWPYLKRRRLRKIFASVYADVNGFELSKKAQQRLQTSLPQEVYGEINNASFISWLVDLNPVKNSVFYDLGAGVGKTVVLAALAFDFAKCIGIEYLSELAEVGRDCLEKLKQQPSVNKLLKKTNVDLFEADFFKYDFNDADIIFINATAFIEIWPALIERLKTVKSGTRLLIVSQQLPADEFQLLKTGLTMMTWGHATVRVYCKL